MLVRALKVQIPESLAQPSRAEEAPFLQHSFPASRNPVTSEDRPMARSLPDLMNGMEKDLRNLVHFLLSVKALDAGHAAHLFDDDLVGRIEPIVAERFI